MRIITALDRVPLTARGSVLAIGNFDGVHLGHQALLAEARARADEMGAPAAVLTFEPHPRSFFRPAGGTPFRLTPFAAKARALARLGVDTLFQAQFDAVLAAMPAQTFILDLLLEQLGAIHIVVGYNFCFGKARSGDSAVLRHMGAMEGFGVSLVGAVRSPAGSPISSTAIRRHLEAGEVTAAAAQLGRPWAIVAPVEQGDRRGRTIGFPTANLRLGEHLVPALGVYAVDVVMPDDSIRWGVANLGRRPTFDQTEVKLEVHLFDFAGDLYGAELEVRLIAHLRAERKFSGLEALTAQIAQDCLAARAALSGRRSA